MSGSGGLRSALVILALLGMEGTARPATPSASEAEVRAALDAIHEDLSKLRFEKVLTALGALLAEPALTEAQRVEALDLRSQAHVARGDLAAAEKDYREILALRPGFVPAEGLTPQKAVARFEKARKSMVGRVRLDVDPEDALVTVDGREVRPGPQGVVVLLAGARRLAAARKGFDTLETSVEVLADREVPVQVHLAPNSRSVVIRTEPEGVSVRLDGVEVGETSRAGSKPSEGGAARPAELILEEVSLGDHVFELGKPCYRDERVHDLLTVDLLERSPKVYGPVTLEPLRGKLVLRGAPEGGEVLVNGTAAGRLPGEPLSLCPGRVAIEVRSRGRAVWRAEADVEADAEAALDVTPRPNAVLLGATNATLPLKGLGSSFSTRRGNAVPAGADLSRPSGWERLDLPPDTDVALAVLPPEGEQSVERWFLYSPILGTVEPLVRDSTELARPTWRITTIGVHLVDSRIGGTCRVVDVVADGPAARAGIRTGDRILRVADTTVSTAKRAMESIAAQPPGASFPIEVARAGATTAVRCTGSASPVLRAPTATTGAAAIEAAWAVVDGVTLPPPEASVAWANLALLLSRSGRHEQAAEAWRRVVWDERPGVGAGTSAYYLGRELASLGAEEEARKAFGRAAVSRATTFRDDGPEVAPAAKDHLADLGEKKPTAR